MKLDGLLGESSTAQEVPSKDTGITNVTCAASKGNRAKRRDSNSFTQVSCWQCWKYHCQGWWHLKSRGGMSVVVAMGFKPR